MDSTLLAVIGLVTLALVFDFLNGFHDAANSIATIVSTRVLSPRQAVIWAAFFNVVAFFIFNHAVAKTMGKGIIDVNIIDAHIIFGALMRAPGIYLPGITACHQVPPTLLWADWRARRW